MWRYRCKSQLITLAVAFLAGLIMGAVALNNPDMMSLVQETVPEALSVIQNQPWLVILSSGIVSAGVINIFLLAQLASVRFGLSQLFVLLIVLMLPEWLLPLGVFALPVTIVISIWGIWSLHAEKSGAMNRKNIRNVQELIRIYTLHHKLDESYKEMALNARRNIRKASTAYALGIVAIFCVILLVDNLMVGLLVVFVYMMAFNYLSRYRSSCFMPIFNLLYQDCNPEACMSALIYFGTHGDKVKLANPALMAECMIYLDDPSLAQDFLVFMIHSTPDRVIHYWSLMATTYYMLSDESGLRHCQEMVEAVKPGFGQVGIMMKNQDLADIENKLNLMKGDFNTCKSYYLDILKKGPQPLIQAQCDYYIALISFVQEDYSLADLYFRKVLNIGGKAYFTGKAAAYLEKIDGMNINTERELSYTPASYERSREGQDNQ